MTKRRCICYATDKEAAKEGIKINIQTIARLAGVSKTTVSRVINHRPDVKPETRERVEQVIRESGFCPNAIAQAVSQQRSMCVGLVFPNDEVNAFSNPYYAELMRGLLGEARLKKYRVVLSYLMNGDCLDLARQKLVDGLLILTPGSDHREKLEQLLALQIPVVATCCVAGMPALHYVAADEYGASCELMEHLVSLGHRHIGFIGGPKTLYSSRRRQLGYLDTLKKHGIPCDSGLVAFGDTGIRSGREIMEDFLRKDDRITAVFACSDLMAIGARQAVEAHGMRVPADVSLVSSDSTSIADYSDAPLTAMDQPICERGEEAMRMLIDMIEGRPVKKKLILPMGITVRGTTAPAKNKEA